MWASNRDGQIGTGTSFQRDDLSIGVHGITLTAIDGHENEGSHSVTIAVEEVAAPAPPQNLIITLIKKIVAWLINLFTHFG